MHRGEWLKNRIDALGYNVYSVADELQVVRTTVWRWLQKEEMPFTKMKMVADVLNIDLREDFPETSFLYKKTKQDYELLYLKEVQNKTWNNYKSFFSNISNWMIEHKYMAVNHFAEIKKKTQATKNRVVIEHEDRLRIYNHLYDSDFDFLIVCQLVFSSLIRPKEIANLKPCDFNLKNQTIFISGTFAKNHQDRISTIPDSMMPLLKKWNFNNAASNQYIFGTNLLPGSKPVDSKRFAKKWEKLRRELKLDKEMKLYSLRDSGIIQMLNDGISIEEVRKQADHSSLEMTTIYTKHASPNGSEQIKSKNSGF